MKCQILFSGKNKKKISSVLACLIYPQCGKGQSIGIFHFPAQKKKKKMSCGISEAIQMKPHNIGFC